MRHRRGINARNSVGSVGSVGASRRRRQRRDRRRVLFSPLNRQRRWKRLPLRRLRCLTRRRSHGNRSRSRRSAFARRPIRRRGSSVVPLTAARRRVLPALRSRDDARPDSRTERSRRVVLSPIRRRHEARWRRQRKTTRLHRNAREDSSDAWTTRRCGSRGVRRRARRRAHRRRRGRRAHR